MENKRQNFSRQSQIRKIIHSQKAFVNVLNLSILPILISLILFSSNLLIYFNLHLKSHLLCRQSLYSIQKKYASFLKELLKLNKKAKKLNQKRKLADLLLKIAKISLNPVKIKAAKIYQKTVIAEQLILKAQQKKIIFQSFLFNIKSRNKLKKEFKKTFPRYLTNTYLPLYSLKIKEAEKNSLTPIYLPVDYFYERQKIKMSWSFSIKEKKVHFYCSASIKKKGGKWIPILTEDKFS